MATIGNPATAPSATPEPPDDEPVMSDQGRDVAEISQWRLMYRRFKQSKLAVGGSIVLLFMYLAALFAHFLSPNDYTEIDSNYKNAAPSKLTWDGGLAVCGVSQTLNEETFTWEYASDCDNAVPLNWFSEGYSYKFLGLIPSSIHLVTVDQQAAEQAAQAGGSEAAPGGDSEQIVTRLYLWGADTQGRDVFARTLHGARVSLTVGLLGVGISTVLAAVIGTFSGYFGGKTDGFVQRVTEVILSVPTLPLWATLAAILPRGMPVVERYFYITLILSLVVWASVARQVRGKVMSYAKADYVNAARAAGSSHARIILTHMLPNSMSHIIVVAMLALPVTIIAETSLSFLGIGMLPPAVSWGVLLQEAQRVDVVTTYPWMLIPAVAVIITVTCYQLLGDGVRDALDPYG